MVLTVFVFWSICGMTFASPLLRLTKETYSPLRIQDVQVWVMAEWYSAPTVTQLLAQSAVTGKTLKSQAI